MNAAAALPRRAAPGGRSGWRWRLLLAVMAAALGGGCYRQNPGATPGTVHWDRDMDEECGMVVSDRRFAAQAIEPGGRVHNFGDAGCLILWLERQPWKADARLWVRDRQADRWIAPRSAGWKAGEFTPSAHGFGASSEAGYGTLTFDQVREAVLLARARHLPPGGALRAERQSR